MGNRQDRKNKAQKRAERMALDIITDYYKLKKRESSVVVIPAMNRHLEDLSKRMGNEKHMLKRALEIAKQDNRVPAELKVF